MAEKKTTSKRLTEEAPKSTPEPKAESAVVPVPDEPSQERIVQGDPQVEIPTFHPPSGLRVVYATSNENITLDSGASFSLMPGQGYTVSEVDAQALIESGNARSGDEER